MTRCFNPRARAGRDAENICRRHLSFEVSIHAPVRGATHLTFNDAAHEIVSIHAPVRGATIGIYCFGKCRGRFNPRARAGRDMADLLEFKANTCFNPRARAGRDSIKQEKFTRVCGFNPRARAGRDYVHFNLLT